MHVLASPSGYHSFGSVKEILLTTGLLTTYSFKFSNVELGEICCSEVSIRCTDSKILPINCIFGVLFSAPLVSGQRADCQSLPVKGNFFCLRRAADSRAAFLAIDNRWFVY